MRLYTRATRHGSLQLTLVAESAQRAVRPAPRVHARPLLLHPLQSFHHPQQVLRPSRKLPKQRLTITRAAVAALKEMDEDPLQCTQPQSTQLLILMMPGSMQASAAKKSDDTGDAFELSQLLFVVGHVAVKHIVYLELVEREWKQQRQEKELGKYIALLYIAGSLMSGFYLFSGEACQGCWG